jgi:hypothetical protein
MPTATGQCLARTAARAAVPDLYAMPQPTLLLIDDENRLRQVLARVLELEGYTVLPPTPAAACKP